MRCNFCKREIEGQPFIVGTEQKACQSCYEQAILLEVHYGEVNLGIKIWRVPTYRPNPVVKYQGKRYRVHQGVNGNKWIQTQCEQ